MKTIQEVAKATGYSLRLYNYMRYWMFKDWLRYRMHEQIKRHEKGLCH